MDVICIGLKTYIRDGGDIGVSLNTYGSHVGSFETGPLILQEKTDLAYSFYALLVLRIMYSVLRMDNYGNGNTGSFSNLAALR